MKKYDHFIDGAWRQPSSGHWLESIDPASGRAWAKIARGNKTDAELAVEAAHRAFSQDVWSSKERRVEMLHDFADILESGWKELVETEVRDNGKRIAEVRAQLCALPSWYRYFSDQALKINDQTLSNSVAGIKNTACYEPFGVVIAIIPWNSPLMIAAWKAAPALAAGNTIVIKPSEHASVSTLEFANLVKKSSIPDGVVNVVTGLGEEVGEPLIRHPSTRKVTFTGSTSGGSRVAETAASGIVPVTLELGGKSPQIVFADANIDDAVNGIVSGIFLSGGQTCVAGSRLLVEASIHDQLVGRIVERAKTLRAGDPLEPETQIAPLANAPHLNKVLRIIESAKNEGAECQCGGGRIYPEARPDGFYVAPTVFTEVMPSMSVWREEVFGPVLAVTKFNTEREALHLANDTQYGLAAGIWTSDCDRAQRFGRAIQAGTIYINHYRSVDPGSPIGGYKRSGYGRELGPDAVKSFLQVKSVWVGTMPCADPFPAQAS